MNKARTMSHAELAQVFKEGLEVNVLLESHTLRELKRVRTSRVLAAEEGRLILSWPQPVLPRPVLGTILEISLMLPVEGKPQRYSFQTRVNETLFGFATTEGGSQQAVVVDFPSASSLSPSTLRLFLRTTVPQEMGLKVDISSLGVFDLLDLSIKGLSLSMPANYSPPGKGEVLAMSIIGFDERLEVSGRVVGMVELEDRLQLSVELLTMPVANALALKMLIRQIEAVAARRKGE